VNYPWRLRDTIMPGGCYQRLELPADTGHGGITARKRYDHGREWMWWTTVSGGIERKGFGSMPLAMADAEQWLRKQGITPEDCAAAERKQKQSLDDWLERNRNRQL
jgi:hypothetical protein